MLPTVSPLRVVLLLGIGMAMSLLGDATLYIVLPTHTADAGILLSHVGLMLSANRLIRIVINGPLGLLIERLPRRRILIPAMLLGSFSTLLYTVGGFWPLLIGRLLWGVSWAGIWIGSTTVMLDIVTDANRGRLIGRFNMWFYIGIGACSIAGGVLTDWLGYNAALGIGALVVFIAAVMWWLLLPETRPAQAAALSESPAETATVAPKTRLIFTPPVILAIVLMGINWLIFIGVIGAILPRLLQERVGETVSIAGAVVQIATLTGTLTAANMAVSLLSSPLAGWLSDHLRNRWALVVGGLLVGIFATAAIVEGDGRAVILATMFTALTSSILQTQVMTLVGDHAGNKQGRALGVMTTVSDIGAAAGPLLAYALLPLIGLGGIFLLATLLLLAVLPLVLRVAWGEYSVRSSVTAGN